MVEKLSEPGSAIGSRKIALRSLNELMIMMKLEELYLKVKMGVLLMAMKFFQGL